MIRYRISCPDPLSHIVHVTMDFGLAGSQLFQSLYLPVWRPGRYEIANFAKNILKTEAYTKKGDRLQVEKESKSHWVIDTKGNRHVIVNYQYFAFQMDAGSSWLHDEQLYLNFINCLMYLPGRMDEAVDIELDLPEAYEFACSLRRAGKGLHASNYYEAVDSPFIASNHLQHLSYTVDGVNFHLYYIGAIEVDNTRLLQDFSKFTNAQVTLFGDLPTKDYYFLFQFLPYQFYHGVEHANSTVITIGPGTGEHTEEVYEKLLGISSHELFHAWNVTRIRPKELYPYDFSAEIYFDTGFVAEGFTTYYGDLMLVTSGVYELDWYLKELNKLLKRHFLNLGRLNLSVTQSSMDLWLDGYVTGAPNRKGSIYVEGAVVALMMDLSIRQNSGYTHSLDDIMRELWLTFYKENKGYRKEDILMLCEKYAGGPMRLFFEKHIEGTWPTELTLKPLADAHGLLLAEKLPESLHERLLGFRVKHENNRIFISHIHPQSRAYHFLSIEDELVDVNGERNTSKITAAFKQENLLTIQRGTRQIKIQLNAATESFYRWYELEVNSTAGQAELARLKNWLGIR